MEVVNIYSTLDILCRAASIQLKEVACMSKTHLPCSLEEMMAHECVPLSLCYVNGVCKKRIITMTRKLYRHVMYDIVYHKELNCVCEHVSLSQ